MHVNSCDVVYTQALNDLLKKFVKCIENKGFSWLFHIESKLRLELLVAIYLQYSDSGTFWAVYKIWLWNLHENLQQIRQNTDLRNSLKISPK